MYDLTCRRLEEIWIKFDLFLKRKFAYSVNVV